MELSLIIPIFNAEKTIRKTLDAISAQKLCEIEVLLIDNGSTDNSSQICRDYVKKDSRFKYFYVSKSGVSLARNKGLELAKGKYVCFCDADDVPNENMYGILLSDIKEHQTDVVMCNYYSQRDDVVSKFPNQLTGVVDKNGIEEYLIPAMFGGDKQVDAVWGTVWRCIFKKEIIDANFLKFDEKLTFAEDLLFVITYLNASETVFFETENLYYYTYTPGSAMLSYNKVKSGLFVERAHLIESLIKALEQKNLYERNIECINQVFQEYVLECVGNASIKQKDNTFRNALANVRTIVRNSLVKSIFKTKNKVGGKRRIVFSLIKQRQALILLLYYRLRKRH